MALLSPGSSLIGRWWPGVLMFPSMKNLLNGGGMERFCEKIHFEENLCYPLSHKIIWLQTEEILWDSSRDGRPQNHFLTAVAKAAA
jgi:hypothetical protein